MPGIPEKVKDDIDEYKRGIKPWPEVMNAYEAAAYIRMPYCDFVRKIKAGHPIPHWREGTRIFSRKDELDEYTIDRIRQQMGQTTVPGTNIRPLNLHASK